MQRRVLFLLLIVLLAVGALPVVRSVGSLVPDSLHVLIFGKPDIELDVAGLLAAGAGLRETYRAKWQAATFAPEAKPFAGARRICVESDPREDCEFRSLAEAMAAAEDNDRFLMSPGLYQEATLIDPNGIRIRAEPGAHLKGRAAKGKAALVVRGDDTVIEGLECSDIAVRDRNGACIRLEGRNLTLRGVHFHDSEQGILTNQGAGKIVVEDSLFERLGADGQAHGLYIGGTDSELEMRRTHVISTKGEGHGVKSRGVRTVIEDSVIASLDGQDSRLIDLPNGGLNVIRGNLLQNGRHSSNADVIGIGLELKEPASDAAKNRSEVTGNIIILERRTNNLVHSRQVPAVEFRGNAVVGGSRDDAVAGNHWFRSRNLAGLGAPPGLLE